MSKNQTLRIKAMDFYFDGGTTMLKTQNGNFYIDRRLKTKTPLAIYDAYPGDDGANIIDETKFVNDIKKAIRIFSEENPTDEGAANLFNDLATK